MKSRIGIVLLVLTISNLSCNPKPYQLASADDDCIYQLKNIARLLSKPDQNGIYSINWHLIDFDLSKITPELLNRENNDSLLLATDHFDSFSEKKLKSYFVVYKQFELVRVCVTGGLNIHKNDIIKYWGKPSSVSVHENSIRYKFDYGQSSDCPNFEEKLLANQYKNCNYIYIKFDDFGWIVLISNSVECCAGEEN